MSGDEGITPKDISPDVQPPAGDEAEVERLRKNPLWSKFWDFFNKPKPEDISDQLGDDPKP
jgi:hypothetical protein